jgi:type II secretion system protein G
MHKRITLKNKSRDGFTIVELLIVIVVIGILAAITIVAYNGVQTRARDATRKSDLAVIAKAIQLYYADNGVYPPGSTGWCTELSNPVYPQTTNALKTYISQVPQDPKYANTANDYFYANNGTGFSLYAQMESSGNGSYSSGGCATIGGAAVTYTYAYGQ